MISSATPPRCDLGLVLLSGLMAGLPFALMQYNISFAVFSIIGVALFSKQLLKLTSVKQGFVWGWVFGLAFHTVSLYWIVVALSVDWHAFWMLAPLALFGIPAYLSLYIGLISSVTVYYHSKSMLARYLIFCCGWIAMELFRGCVLLEFPWNIMGYIWVHSKMIHLVSWIGIYGLTILSVFILCLPVLAKSMSWKKYTLFASIFFITDNTLTRVIRHDPVQYSDHVVHVVQPNITQAERWDANNIFNNFYKTLSMTPVMAQGQDVLIIWPESGVDFYLDESVRALSLIQNILQPNQILITGSSRRSVDPFQIFNSMMVVDCNGEVVACYDKSHLVPFGEYIPLRQYLPVSFTGITSDQVDYSPGDGVKTMQVGTFPSFSPLICFEGVFSGCVLAKGSRPEFLLSTANDAWYGNTAGPYQHLHIVRVRAIEEGLPMVRAANSGISAIIAPNGQILHHLPLSTAGTITAYLPKKDVETVFSKIRTFMHEMWASQTCS